MAARMPFERILVDVDALAAAHPALEQAAALAARCGASLTLVDVLPPLPAAARRYLRGAVEADLVAHRRDCLDSLARGVATRVPDAATAVLRGSPAIAIIEEVLRHGHDLVMRAHGRQHAAGFPPFGTIDLQLLRKCPAPVWLVGPNASRGPARILVAVHANPDDAGETSLNVRLIEFGLALSVLEQARLTLLHAWSAWGEELLAPRLSPQEFSDVIEDARRAARTGMEALTGSFGPRLDGVVVELPKGHPEDVIPAYAAAHDIDLVVMGTVARRGVAGWIMGNTAERVLQRLRCSVVALKPNEFVCPVALPDVPAVEAG
jgi:nucleotide-binding universal stress UspA family protein